MGLLADSVHVEAETAQFPVVVTVGNCGSIPEASGLVTFSIITLPRTAWIQVHAD